MRDSFLVIVTGLPGTGKTTLARAVAARYGAPLIAKDPVKETLFDTLGVEPDLSRRLSDASFAVLACIASELARAGVSCVLDGNFRAGEHEALLVDACTGRRVVAQVLCVADEPTRTTRLRARATDPARHRGHRDLEQSRQPAPEASGRFLDLESARLRYDSTRLPEEVFAALDELLARSTRGQ